MDTDSILAMIIALLAVGDVVGARVLLRKERRLDLATDSGAALARMLKLIRRMMHLHMLAIALTLWFVVRPVVGH